MSDEARRGWDSCFRVFGDTEASAIVVRLKAFVPDAGASQIRAWNDAMPPLQQEVREVLDACSTAAYLTAILEYELPMEARRTDVILLTRGTIVVLELKGKRVPSQADLDQAAAYARDLRCYHRECADRPVLPIVVPMQAKGYIGLQAGVHVAGPDALDTLLRGLQEAPDTPPLSATAFPASSAYRPLPTLVQAARELFFTGQLRPIHRARAATDPAVAEIARVIHEAAATNSRRLVLLTGVPGAGKTLVGLRITP